MRIGVALVFLALIAAPANTAIPEPLPESKQASLRLLDGQRFRVAGQGFKDGERVRVVLSVEDAAERTRRAIANARGSFVVSFGTVGIGRCKAWEVAALGSRGSRAELALPAPLCSPG